MCGAAWNDLFRHSCKFPSQVANSFPFPFPSSHPDCHHCLCQYCQCCCHHNMKQAVSSIFICHLSLLLPNNNDITAFLSTLLSQLHPYSPIPFLCDCFPLHSAQTRSLLVKSFPHLLSQSHHHFSLGQPRIAEALPCLGTHTRFGSFSFPIQSYRSCHPFKALQGIHFVLYG